MVKNADAYGNGDCRSCLADNWWFLTYGITFRLWKMAESFHIPMMKKEVFSKACSHLRDYYGLKEPYIVTKCYDATDKKFKNHDVCLFIVNSELRITTDLIRGFLHGYMDLGCYAFKQDEIVLSKKHENSLLIAELKIGDTVFCWVTEQKDL